MIFNAHQFEPPLFDFIESMFHFKGFMPDHSIERVVPTGHVFIIFELDGIRRNTFDNETLKPLANYEKVWVSGVHKNYLSISAHENSEMFVIQFKPYGALPFIHQFIGELNDLVVPAEDVFGQEILDLHQLIQAASTSEDKFSKGEAWLNERFDQAMIPPAALVDVLSELDKQPVVKYQDVIDKYPHTQKHLIDQFKKYIGLTPKYYQRMRRFNDILQLIQKKQGLNWSDVALQCGYTDQSHFIKEFRHFSGFNPTEFIQKKYHNDEPNFFPVDR